LRANRAPATPRSWTAAAEAIIELAATAASSAAPSAFSPCSNLDQQLVFPSPRPLPCHRRRRFLPMAVILAPRRKTFLFPVKALAKLVRGKLKAALANKRPDLAIPDAAWRKPWVVHCTPWGRGQQPCSITSPATSSALPSPMPRRCPRRQHRHPPLQASQVSPLALCRLAGGEFMRRFSSMSAKGFHKVRYFGLWHPSKRDSPPEHVSCCNSTATSHRSRPSRRSLPPSQPSPIGGSAHHCLTHPGPAHTAIAATSSAFAASARECRWAHEPRRLHIRTAGRRRVQGTPPTSAANTTPRRPSQPRIVVRGVPIIAER